MQDLSTSPSLHVQCDRVTDVRAGELRQHPASCDLGFGWLRISRQEHFPDRLLPVSTSALVSVTFRHERTGFDHVRASLTTSVYACSPPPECAGDDLDADESDTSPAQTAS